MSVPTYAYAANNPLGYVDPNGLWIRSVAPALVPYLQALRSTPTGAASLRRLERSLRPVDFVEAQIGSEDHRGGLHQGKTSINSCGGAITIALDRRDRRKLVPSEMWRWTGPKTPSSLLVPLANMAHEVEHGEQFLDFPDGPPGWLSDEVLELPAYDQAMDVTWEFWP